ncbi:Neuronal acetylcholine receptor subunit alpha-4 [Schistosoma japonicum]|nr:Neuronal acetylcholine receptor subunit alpha-4 [Schistosoma japonicum]
MNQHLNFVLSIVLIIICNGLSQISAIAPKGHPKVLKTKSVEKDLIRMLLNRYEQFGVIGRPVNDSKIKVDVRYGLQLFQILDLDENKQILRTNCWCMHKWTDSLLRWNESEYGNIKTVRIFPSQIWTPDIKLHNLTQANLIVAQSIFIIMIIMSFDRTICMLEFGSLTYDRTQMDILWWIPDSVPLVEMPYLDFSDYVPSNEWCTDGEKERDVHHINRTIQIRSVKKHRRRSQTVGNEVITREYPVLRYLVRLRRNPSFYVFMLVIPCVLLSSLTLVVFWLPPESPAKMMLGMNIFVAFFVLLLLLAESTPSAVKNFPLIGVFFCLNMIMITLSTFLATMVIHLYFRGDRKGAVPLFLRRVIAKFSTTLYYFIVFKISLDGNIGPL